jgi:glutamate dehydrogenase
VEFLPDTQELDARQKGGQGLTRPEISVLLAYAKLSLKDHLLASNLPDEACFASRLIDYFPEAIQKNYPKAVAQHRLRREIIATDLANDVCNGGGPTILARAIDQTGAPTHDVAGAYAVAKHAFDIAAVNRAISALDGKVDGGLQLQLYTDVQDVAIDRTIWFLRHGQLSAGLQDVADRYREKIGEIESQLIKVLPESEIKRFNARRDAMVEKEVPKQLAERLAAWPVLIDATDIVLTANATKSSLPAAARAFYEAGEMFGLTDIYAAAKKLFTKNYFERLALDRAVADLSVANRRLAIQILEAGGMEAWKNQKSGNWQRARETLQGIAAGPDLTVAKLTVAAGQLSDITGS